MSASHQALAINLLYVVAHLLSQKVDHPKTFDEINLNVWDAVDDAALLDPLDEGVAGPVVRDRQPQRVFRLCDLDLLRPALCWLAITIEAALNRYDSAREGIELPGQLRICFRYKEE